MTTVSTTTPLLHVRQVRKTTGPKKWSAPEAFAFLDDICKPENFRRSEFIPPKMVAGCRRYVPHCHRRRIFPGCSQLLLEHAQLAGEPRNRGL